MAAKNSVHVADTRKEKMHERLWHNSPSATTRKEILRFVLQAVVGEIMMKELTQNCAHPKVYGNSTALSWASADCFHRVRQPREYETWLVLMLSRQSNASLPFPPPSFCEHVSFLSHSACILPTATHPYIRQSPKIIPSSSWRSGLPDSCGRTMSVIGALHTASCLSSVFYVTTHFRVANLQSLFEVCFLPCTVTWLHHNHVCTVQSCCPILSLTCLIV